MPRGSLTRWLRSVVPAVLLVAGSARSEHQSALTAMEGLPLEARGSCEGDGTRKYWSRSEGKAICCGDFEGTFQCRAEDTPFRPGQVSFLMPGASKSPPPLPPLPPPAVGRFGSQANGWTIVPAFAPAPGTEPENPASKGELGPMPRRDEDQDEEHRAPGYDF